jgi:hypothetical protein
MMRTNLNFLKLKIVAPEPAQHCTLIYKLVLIILEN